MQGLLIYKCRLCGAEHTPIGAPNILTALTSLVTKTPLPEHWEAGDSIPLLDIHSCLDGRLGISDLVGGKRGFWG